MIDKYSTILFFIIRSVNTYLHETSKTKQENCIYCYNNNKTFITSYNVPMG